MAYHLADVHALQGRVKREIPDAQTSTWCDYGYRLEVQIGERHCVACQPAREGVQNEVFLDIEEIKRRLQLH